MSDDRSPADRQLTGEAEQLAGKLRERSARVRGAGLGFDVTDRRLALVGRGESYIGAVDRRRLGAASGEDRFRAAADLTRPGEPDDAALVVTAQARIYVNLVARHAPRTVDTRGVYPPGTDRVTRASADPSLPARRHRGGRRMRAEQQGRGGRTFAGVETPARGN